MAIGRNPRSVTAYVLKEDRELPEDARTVFELGSIPYSLRGEFLDRVAGQVTNKSNKRADSDAMKATMELLPAVLRGWKNFKDAEGNPIPFETAPRLVFGVTIENAPTDETLSALTYMQVVELMDAMVESLHLTAGDRKN